MVTPALDQGEPRVLVDLQYAARLATHHRRGAGCQRHGLQEMTAKHMVPLGNPLNYPNPLRNPLNILPNNKPFCMPFDSPHHLAGRWPSFCSCAKEPLEAFWKFYMHHPYAKPVTPPLSPACPLVMHPRYAPPPHTHHHHHHHLRCLLAVFMRPARRRSRWTTPTCSLPTLASCLRPGMRREARTYRPSRSAAASKT